MLNRYGRFIQSCSSPVVKLATEPCQGQTENAWNVMFVPGTESLVNNSWHPNTFLPGESVSSIEQGTYVRHTQTPRLILTVRLRVRLVRLHSRPFHLTFHENSTTCHSSPIILDSQCSTLPLHHSHNYSFCVHITYVHNSVSLII
jgi:hypothetical protein